MSRTSEVAWHAFDRGVQTARAWREILACSQPSSVHEPLGLTGQLMPAEQPDYLSGLLIGHEIRALSALAVRSDSTFLIERCHSLDRRSNLVPPAISVRWNSIVTHRPI